MNEPKDKPEPETPSPEPYTPADLPAPREGASWAEIKIGGRTPPGPLTLEDIAPLIPRSGVYLVEAAPESPSPGISAVESAPPTREPPPVSPETGRFCAFAELEARAGDLILEGLAAPLIPRSGQALYRGVLPPVNPETGRPHAYVDLGAPAEERHALPITVELLHYGWVACYSESRLEELFGDRETVTPLEVAHAADVPVDDRLWVLVREAILTPEELDALHARWVARFLKGYASNKTARYLAELLALLRAPRSPENGLALSDFSFREDVPYEICLLAFRGRAGAIRSCNLSPHDSLADIIRVLEGGEVEP